MNKDKHIWVDGKSESVLFNKDTGQALAKINQNSQLNGEVPLWTFSYKEQFISREHAKKYTEGLDEFK